MFACLQGVSFLFEHERDFSVNVSEEFLEYCQEDALSIEVWGHRTIVDETDEFVSKTKSVENRLVFFMSLDHFFRDHCKQQ